MKNLPEDDLINQLGDRLKNFTEEPDDELWEKIRLKRQEPPSWTDWLERGSVIGFVVLFFGLQSLDVTQLSASAEKTFTSRESKVAEAQASKAAGRNETPRSALPYGSPASSSNGTSRYPTSNRELMSQAPVDKLHEDKSFLQGEENILANNDETGKELLVQPEITLLPISQILADTASKPTSLNNKPPGVTAKPSAKKKKKEARVTFYAMVTPVLTFQKVLPISNDAIVVDGLVSPSAISSDRFGFSFEGGIETRLKENFSFYGGLSMYHQDQTVTYKYRNGQSQAAESTQYTSVINPAISTDAITYSMTNVGAQAGILYRLKGEKLQQKIGGGLSFQQGLSKGTEKYNNGKSHYLFYNVLYRSEYKLNEGLRVFVQPSFSYGVLSSEELNAPFKMKPYRVGIGVGIVF